MSQLRSVIRDSDARISRPSVKYTTAIQSRPSNETGFSTYDRCGSLRTYSRAPAPRGDARNAASVSPGPIRSVAEIGTMPAPSVMAPTVIVPPTKWWRVSAV